MARVVIPIIQQLGRFCSFQFKTFTCREPRTCKDIREFLQLDSLQESTTEPRRLRIKADLQRFKHLDPRSSFVICAQPTVPVGNAYVLGLTILGRVAAEGNVEGTSYSYLKVSMVILINVKSMVKSCWQADEVLQIISGKVGLEHSLEVREVARLQFTLVGNIEHIVL